MKNFCKWFLVLGISISSIYASGTNIGLADKSLGLVHIPYSASGMGKSFETADNDSLHLNYLNFSQWANIARTTYEVDFSYRGARGESKVEDNLYRDRGNFQGGFVAFPLIARRLAFGVGVQPVTDMEFALKDSIKGSSEDFLLIRGGLSRGSLNFSYKILDNIGIGLGYEYNFGRVTDKYIRSFNNFPGGNVEFEYEYRFFGHGAVASAHASLLDFIYVGAQFRTPVFLNTEIIARSRSNAVNGSRMVKVELPAQANIGAKLQFSNRLSVGADYFFQDWKNGYKINFINVSKYQHLFQRIGAGIQIHASSKRFTSLLNAMDFRAGAFYGTQNQTSSGNLIEEYGVSAGFSLPLLRFRSRIDFSGIFGKRGSLTSNYYEEMFFNIGVSVTASELWFVNIDE